MQEHPVVTGHIFMAMSLDGFVARKDHTIDWLIKQKTESEEHGFAAFEASNDCIIMGSGSFKTVLGFDSWIYTKPVIVMSGSMVPSDIPEKLQSQVTISDESPTTLMRSLTKKGYARAYVDGGKIVQSFIREGLIASLSITLVPILIGNGLRLFGALKRDIDLSLIHSRSYDSGLVQLQYRVA